MDIQWMFLFENAWPIFWISTVYSYFSCMLIGVSTGIKTKGNREKINKNVENFIISPFYVATFFCLLAVLYFWKGMYVFQNLDHLQTVHMLLMGLLVFVGHFVIEVLESTFIWKNPLRILSDPDAIRLCGIYLLIILETSVIAAIVL